MQLEPFLLDRWLEQKHHRGLHETFDLASSTGPILTLRELLEVSGERGFIEDLLGSKLTYTPTDGLPELREAIAAFESVEPESVLACTGASEALLMSLYCAAEPGANVVIPDPDFPSITSLARSLGIEVRHYHLRRELAFEIDPESVTSLVDEHTKLVLVISPHNPTGAVVPDAMRRLLHDFCATRGVQFICDQVYHPVYHSDEASIEPTSAAALPAATVIGDCSKALSLSGLRVGWLIEHDASRRERYFDARAYFTISNTALGERLAALAVRNYKRILVWARHETLRNVELLDCLFREHQDFFGWVRPAGGYTAFPWLLREADSAPFCRWLVRERGILVAPGECFRHPAHFRIGFGATGARLPQAVERLDDAVRAYKKMKRQ